MTSRHLTLLASLTLLGRPALAAEPASVLAALGISGTWAPSCDQPVTRQSPRATFVPESDGRVTIRLDAGPGGVSANVVTAASSAGSELQTSTFTAFADIPKPLRDAFERDNMRPDITTRTIYSVETKGVLVVKDRFIQVSTLTGEAHVIAGGFMINQSTKQPTQKAPPLLKCSD